MAKKKPSKKPGRKPSKKPRPFVERDEGKQIDNRAKNIFLSYLPAGWVENPLPDDCGKDHHIEITAPVVWNDGKTERTTERVTGNYNFYVQRKGMKTADVRLNGTVVAYEIEVRSLNLWFETALPVFLVIVDVNTRRTYWLFVQEYLIASQDWRSQSSYTLHIPVANDLSTDFPAFEKAVIAATNFLRFLRGPTLREAIDIRIKGLEKKDRRFQVEPLITRDVEKYIFTPKERVTLNLVAHGEAASAKLKEMIEKGIKVDIAPNEFTFEGSPLFDELTSAGGALQIEAKWSGTVTLVCLDEAQQETGRWDDLPGLFHGGRAQVFFDSTLSNSPVVLKIGPIGQSLGGKLGVSIDLDVWLDKPVRSACWFDKTYSLCNGLVKGKSLVAAGHKDGNRFCRLALVLSEQRHYLPFLELVETLRKARRIAEHCDVNPICTPQTILTRSAFLNIAVAYGVLFENGYYSKGKSVSISTSITRAEAEEIINEPERFKDISFRLPQADAYEFMGIPIKIGLLGIHMTNVGIMLDKLKEQIAIGSVPPEVSFFSTDESETTVHLWEEPDDQKPGSDPAPVV